MPGLTFTVAHRIEGAPVCICKEETFTRLRDSNSVPECGSRCVRVPLNTDHKCTGIDLSTSGRERRRCDSFIAQPGDYSHHLLTPGRLKRLNLDEADDRTEGGIECNTVDGVPEQVGAA